MTRAVRLGWMLCACTWLWCAATAALYLTSSLDSGAAFDVGDGFPVTPLGAALSALLGAMILARHPHHRVGWLLLIGQAGTALGVAADAYAYRVLVEHELGPAAAGHLVAWFAHLFGAAYALPATFALFLLVPDGRLPSRRWRPVLVLLAGSYALAAGVPALTVRPLAAGVGTHLGPVADMAFAVSALMLLAGALGAAVALVRRLRRSGGAVRRQLRWIAAPAVVLAAGVLYALAYPLLVGGTANALVGVYIGFALVPIGTGIAVLRYRLYDIDVIISRALVLAVLAAFVTIGYITIVVAVSAGVGTRVDRRFWPSLAILVLLALAFQPLRQRVLRLTDRLVYGPRAVPYEALATFSEGLARSPAPAQMLPVLAEAVGRGIGAASASVRLDVAGGARLTAAWPTDAVHPPDLEIAVCHDTEPLGQISVTMPPGRRLRRSERRLLDDFAGQAGVALRNLRLDAELRAQIGLAAERSAVLAASGRRLIGARDAERQRVAEVIGREVLSHLCAMPAELAVLDVADRDLADSVLLRLETAAAAGLDALREVTRGLYPVVLLRRGLVAALVAEAARLGRAGALTVGPGMGSRRFAEPVEAAVYFCASSLLREPEPAAGLSGALSIALSLEGDDLVLAASGCRPTPRTAIVDRVAVAGGEVAEVPDGLRLWFPGVASVQAGAASAQMAASRAVPNEDFAT